jgi:threonine dehydrogenase-like Zn-dependent dehydrogenase
VLAAVLTGRHQWRVAEVPVPATAPGEVLIRTEIAAVCGSDLHAAADATSAQPPGYPGHEAVGTVIESRSERFGPGDRVLCVPPAATSRCFAQFQVLAEASVIPLPPLVPASELVVAQQLGTAIFAMKRFWPARDGSGRTAAVLGTGPAGLAFVALLRRAGFDRVVVSDLSAARLAVAAELGASTLVNAAEQDVLDVVMELTSGDGVDLVIEAAGRDASRHQAMRMVAVEGRIGLFGVEEKPGLSSYPLAEVFRRRPTIEMTWGAQFETGLTSFAEAATLVTAGGTGISGLVSHQIPLDGIEKAFQLAGDPQAGAIKVAITFGTGDAGPRQPPTS